MIRRSTLIAVEILLGLVAAVAIGLGVAWWRLSQGPVELGFIQAHVQSELNAARGGRPVGLERVQLAWSNEAGALQLRAVGVTVEDGRGAVLSRSDALIELRVLPLIIGRISVERAEFLGGEMTLTHKADGETHIAFGPEGAPPDIILAAPPPNETLEARVARLLDGMDDAFRPVGPGGSLRGLAVRNAKLNVIDEMGGGRWTAENAVIELAREGRTLALAADARLEGARGAAPAHLRITTDTRFQSALLEFGADQVRPRALFSPAALGPFAGLDAPLTTTITIGLDRKTGVTRFEGDAEIGAGVAVMDAGTFRIDGGRVRGRYDLAGDELIIDQVELGGEKTRIDGEMRVERFSAMLRAGANEASPFRLRFSSMRLDLPGIFPNPVSLTNVTANGELALSQRSIRVARLYGETDNAAGDVSGRFYWGEAPDGRVYPGLEMEGRLIGILDARRVMDFWPIGLGESARHYVFSSLTAGRVTQAVARLDIRPADIASENGWRNEAVDVRFDVVDGGFRFVETMSAVSHARGSGVLHGNSFNLSVSEARFNNLAVTAGRVDVPHFKPEGGMVTVAGRAEGEARNLVAVLLQDPINLRERLPVRPETVTGVGAVALTLQRPLRNEVPFEDWRFTVDGRIQNFGGAMVGRDVTLNANALTVRGDQRAVVVSGPMRAGVSEIGEVRWTEHIDGNGPSVSEYRIAGMFDARDLDRLGYPVGELAEGRIGVTISGQGRGFDVDHAQIELDLTNAAVTAPFGYWSKNVGAAASARFNVARHADGGMVFSNIDARGAGLFAQGGARLARDGALIDATISRFIVEGRTNARITAARALDGGVDVNVRGPMFDAAPFMSMSGGPAPAANSAAKPAAAAVRADVAVDRLRMRGGAVLHGARVNLMVQGGALRSLIADGRSPGDQAFSLALGPRPTDPAGGIRFRADDAGFAVRALTGADNIIGGVATADGSWRPGPPSVARFRVQLRDYEVVRVPAMARLLSSIGSLTGLAEALNGEGIGFALLDAQLVYANDRVTFTEGRMSGPSLGLTGSGAYELARDNLDIDGVVVPSPGLNLSMFGGIPIIGDLLVSRRGEGMFAMTYALNGPAAAPRVGVNPVSVIAPGIFRRIFEPISRTAPPGVSEGDAAEAGEPRAEVAAQTPAVGAP
jgi:hypothetical protein